MDWIWSKSILQFFLDKSAQELICIVWKQIMNIKKFVEYISACSHNTIIRNEKCADNNNSRWNDKLQLCFTEEKGLHAALRNYALKVWFTWQWRLNEQTGKSSAARRHDETPHASTSPTNPKTRFLQLRLSSAVAPCNGVLGFWWSYPGVHEGRKFDFLNARFPWGLEWQQQNWKF